MRFWELAAYQQAVRSVFRERLTGLGFTLRRDRFDGALVAESEFCRVWFNPYQFILLVQRVSRTPKEACPAYDLNLLLKATGSDDEFHLQPLQGHDPVKAEVDRMVRLLVAQCRPILDGDEVAWRRARELGAEKENEALARLGEVGLRLKDGERWRELPELDSVTAKGGNKPINALLTLLLLAIPGGYTIFLAVVYWVALFGPPQKDTLVMVLAFSAFGVPMVLLDVWIVRKVLLCQYYWETSKHGLAIGTFLKKQFVPWTDVESALLLPGRGYELQTPGRTIRLERSALRSACLEASIWQHLNRLDKADTTPLSPFAMSLWAQIPEETQEEIQWETPAPPHALDILLKLAAWEALIWGIVVYFKLEVALPLFVISAYPVLCALYSLVLIKRIAVLGDRIEACTALGSLSISWEAVHSLKFMVWFLQPPSMLIRAGAFRFLRIPWLPKHPNSTRVMLAIIKRLRQEERFKLLPFPAALLMAAYGGDQEENRSMLR